jgi:pimeloyl-ACP methyl ester carboxylesterase
MAEPAYSEGEWLSGDGLRLHYRDYPAVSGENGGRPPLLCLHALTRNARDFEPVAARFAGDWRLIVPDMRGRGQSEYARDPATYQVETYVDDVVRLLQQLDCGAVVVVGTSMGGVIAMQMALANAWPLAGVVLNDIGPEIDPAGLERIRQYVGQGGSFETWMHAARHLREPFGKAYPDYRIDDWLSFAKRVMVLAGNGRVVFDYDMKIAEPFNAAGPGPAADLWPSFRSLIGRPLLAIRGELSDILSAATLKRMKAEIKDMEVCTIPRTGHPPALSEPEAQAALEQFFSKVHTSAS